MIEGIKFKRQKSKNSRFYKKKYLNQRKNKINYSEFTKEYPS